MADLPSGIDWKTLYDTVPVEEMPWFCSELDSDVADELSRLFGSNPVTARSVLDIGTGAGTQAIELALRGFSVTATDISSSAIEGAKARALSHGITIDLRVDDILRTQLSQHYDLVIDRGCFHVLPPDKRQVYATNIRALIKPGGYLLLKCFSPKEIRSGGPHRITLTDLDTLLAGGFEEIAIRESVYQGTLVPAPHAWFVSARRVR